MAKQSPSKAEMMRDEPVLVIDHIDEQPEQN